MQGYILAEQLLSGMSTHIAGRADKPFDTYVSSMKTLLLRVKTFCPR